MFISEGSSLSEKYNSLGPSAVTVPTAFIHTLPSLDLLRWPKLCIFSLPRFPHFYSTMF